MYLPILVGLVVCAAGFLSLTMIALAAALLYTYHRIGTLATVVESVGAMATEVDSIQASLKRLAVRQAKDAKTSAVPGVGQLEPNLFEQIEGAHRSFPLS